MRNKYSIEELLKVLKSGAEIDFVYDNNKFSISQANGLFIVTKHIDWENYQSFNSAYVLVENALVDGQKLKDIWNNVYVIMWF